MPNKDSASRPAMKADIRKPSEVMLAFITIPPDYCAWISQPQQSRSSTEQWGRPLLSNW
jgi:hypothetical protein